MEKKADKKMIATYVLIGVVIAVLVFSVMQTFGINELQQTLSNQASSGTSVTAKAVSAMVGGC